MQRKCDRVWRFHCKSSEAKTANILSPSIIEHIVNSSGFSSEYENTEYETKHRISQDSLSLRKWETPLPNVSQACNRTGVLYTLATILINTVMRKIRKDLVDRRKIRTERIKILSDLKRNIWGKNHFIGMGDWWPKSKDFIVVKHGKSLARRTISEEHAIRLSETSLYLGHIIPISGS